MQSEKQRQPSNLTPPAAIRNAGPELSTNDLPSTITSPTDRNSIMKTIAQQFSVSFKYKVHFTEGLFHPENTLLAETIRSGSPHKTRKVLFVLDEGMYAHHPKLFKRIQNYSREFDNAFTLIKEPVVIPGGEAAKNNPEYITNIHEVIKTAGLDRHAFVAAVGGGAVIDAAGYAAATAHRGVRMIRIPTTVLAQNDAAVGVKNGINAYGTKNFLGAFTPPFAVLNDAHFLKTLDHRDWRSGISEAIKVALLKDPEFFDFIQSRARRLDERDNTAMEHLI